MTKIYDAAAPDNLDVIREKYKARQPVARRAKVRIMSKSGSGTVQTTWHAPRLGQEGRRQPGANVRLNPPR